MKEILKIKLRKAQLTLYNHRLLLLIVGIGAVVGLYQLDNLPAEMWGDAIAHYGLAENVKHGYYFYNYAYGGDGPIYTYLVVFVSWFFGLSFYTLKLTSVLIYLGFIIMMYLLTEALFKKKDLALLTAFLAAVSFWSITFARQPHARMLVPLFITLSMYFAVKNKTLLSGFFLGVGMYTQASFWAMPLVFWKRHKILLLGLLLTIPLVINFITAGGFFTNQSYFGEKLATSDNLPVSEAMQNIAHNISANFFSFITRGDEGFRLNVPNSPHLDAASAIFFFIGFILLVYQVIKRKQMKYLEFIILPFFIIQVPSLLDIHNPFSQPNIGRMIGVIPFVYMSTAYGLKETCTFITKKMIDDAHVRKVLSTLCLFYLLLVILVANCYKYFIIYPHFLPDQNTPFAGIIAKTIDHFSSQTTVYIIGSGWSEHGQPEQQAITYSLSMKHTVNFMQPGISQEQLCTIAPHSVVITSPSDTADTAALASCNRILRSYLLEQNAYTVAKVLEIK